MIKSFKGQFPRIHKDVFVAPTAVIIGDVEIEAGASIWFNTVIRGDVAPIKIGKQTNIQDNSTLHAETGQPLIIGNHVTIGHNAVIHGCTIADHVLVGIHAVVLNGANIHSASVVAAGAVVREGQEVGPHHLVAGIPARLKREFTEAVLPEIQSSATIYGRLSRVYLAQLDKPAEDG